MIVTALIDADILVYRIAFGKKDEDETSALAALDETIYTILESVEADAHVFYLSDSTANNFRTILYPEYKANRKAKPDHYEVLKNHLMQTWCAEVCFNMEADDALSLNSHENDEEETIIVSIDKDLLQVPGLHYNFVNKEFIRISKWQGLYNLYTQILVGDSTDNIKGCKGIGKVKTAKLLEPCNNEQELYEVVRKAYNDDAAMVLNTTLVWLLSNDRKNLILEKHK